MKITTKVGIVTSVYEGTPEEINQLSALESITLKDKESESRNYFIPMSHEEIDVMRIVIARAILGDQDYYKVPSLDLIGSVQSKIENLIGD
jgi:hypothetical protein